MGLGSRDRVLLNHKALWSLSTSCLTVAAEHPHVLLTAIEDSVIVSVFALVVGAVSMYYNHYEWRGVPALALYGWADDGYRAPLLLLER